MDNMSRLAAIRQKLSIKRRVFPLTAKLGRTDFMHNGKRYTVIGQFEPNAGGVVEFLVRPMNAVRGDISHDLSLTEKQIDEAVTKERIKKEDEPPILDGRFAR